MKSKKMIDATRTADDKSYVSAIRLKHPMEVYNLSRTGMKITPMAQALKIPKLTLKAWLENPDIKAAFDQGRKESGKGQKSFHDYVYDNLSDDLKPIWSAMQAASGGDAAAQKGLEMLKVTRRQRQYLFLHALIVNNFNVKESCRVCNIPHRMIQEWREKPEFEDMMRQIMTMRKDFVESQLMGLIAAGDPAAVIFANKTLNRDRGYDTKMVVEHTGTVQHSADNSFETVLAMLPIDLKRKVLECIRKGKPAMLPAHTEVEVDPQPVEDVEDADYVVKGDE